MGRRSTGATSTTASMRVSIADLKKYGILRSDSIIKGSIRFSSGGHQTGSISVSANTTKEPFIQLKYQVTDYRGKKTDIEYNVDLVEVPSNLGKGFRYYFRCPFSYRKCSILYLAYGSHHFKSREAYRYRIYYPCQMESKGVAFRHHAIKAQLEELYPKQVKSHYRGQETRIGQRITRLEAKYEHFITSANYNLLLKLRRMGCRI